MGFFSWMTADTNRSITNRYASGSTFPVYVLCPDGTSIREDNYEGYGVFGGKDVYALLAKWNAPEKCNGDVVHDRSIGISIDKFYDTDPEPKYPIKIVEDPSLRYEDVGASPICPDQGYFLPEDDEDE